MLRAARRRVLLQRDGLLERVAGGEVVARRLLDPGFQQPAPRRLRSGQEDPGVPAGRERGVGLSVAKARQGGDHLIAEHHAKEGKFTFQLLALDRFHHDGDGCQQILGRRRRAAQRN